MPCPLFRPRAILGLLVAMAPMLQADEPLTPPLRTGFELLGAAPVGELRYLSAGTALGLALFAEQDLGPATRLQTRISYVQHPEARRLTLTQPFPLLPGLPRSISINSAAIGVEAQRTFGPARSVFVLGGVSAIRYEFRSTWWENETDPDGIVQVRSRETKLKTSMKAGISVGAGYRFKDASALTLRYLTVPVDGTRLGTVQGGFSLYF